MGTGQSGWGAAVLPGSGFLGLLGGEGLPSASLRGHTRLLVQGTAPERGTKSTPIGQSRRLGPWLRLKNEPVASWTQVDSGGPGPRVLTLGVLEKGLM